MSGSIASLVTSTLPPSPEPPGAIPIGFRLFGLVMVLLGLASAALVFLVGRSAGSNTVPAGGAAVAAFGELAVPGEPVGRRDVATQRVPDSRLAELATIEFAPPRGLEPWQAAVILREAVDDDSVAAWFSEMFADEAIIAADDGGTVRLTRGPDTSRLSSVDLAHLQRLFVGGEVVELGAYDKEFTATWQAIASEQRPFASNAGWWSRGGPGGCVTTPTKQSFRRFLAASEGKHVDWAWQHGLVREYNAWAVALGAAGAWSNAVKASNIPDPQASLSGPLLLYSASSAFSSSRTVPSSSGGSGGGGSGGGSVGGGGGGGSSGSW